MNGQVRIDERRRRRRQAGRRGFTLIELLVVILIILLVSAVVLPTVLPALSHRQVSEAARILQGALAGARDTAINNNAPAGIRLLPDPVLNGINPSTAALDPTRILASNRYIPIQLAPDYSEGLVNVDTSLASLVAAFNAAGINPASSFPYPAQKGGGFYPAGTNTMLYLEESVYTVSNSSNQINSPTSWYWNIRIGDKIQLNNTGIWYTIVGPMNIYNPELFVNVGNPGTTPPLLRTVPTNYNPEFLFLVNGVDDNRDGYVDNGWDGVDNDGDGIVDQVIATGVNPLGEWVETETWQGAILNVNNQNIPYTITRRPVVSPGSRETPLPSNVVVDLTTWNAQYFNVNFSTTTGVSYVSERSRLPVDPTTGYVDILLNPNGTVVPTTVYSSPSSFGMDSAFYHFWLAERGDLFDPAANPHVPYLLPMVPGSTYAGGTPYPYTNPPDPLGTRALTGERRLMTLFTRTGQLVTNQIETFDATAIPPGPGPNFPFLAPQQGIRGDTR
jgi:prepilin-type N-terminal cleavage/methylation domain-containing protein